MDQGEGATRAMEILYDTLLKLGRTSGCLQLQLELKSIAEVAIQSPIALVFTLPEQSVEHMADTICQSESCTEEGDVEGNASLLLGYDRFRVQGSRMG